MTVTDPERTDLGGNVRHGDDDTFNPTLWRYIIERFAIHSVLDVGCGEGHAVDWFNRNGVYAVGIDGLGGNVLRAVHPIIRHDLINGPFDMPCVDMVWSCEVAEHIDEAFVDSYIGTLSNGTIVAMTHAVPGQGGYHHVNEQPSDYWIAKMERAGYVLHPVTPRARQIEPWTYFGQTGLIFTRG